MGLTQIQGSMSLALGLGPVVGQIRISNPPFTDVEGNFHPASSATVPIASDGSYSFALAPTTNSIAPNAIYQATYYLGIGQAPYTEYWSVPEVDFGVVLTIQQIRFTPSFPSTPLSIPVEQLFSATGSIGDVLVNTGGGYAPVTLQSVYEFTFTNAQSFVVPQSHHGQGTSLIIQMYASDGSQLDGAVNVNPALGDVSVTFTTPQTGQGFIYGGLGHGLPSYARTVIYQETVVVKQSEHRFNSPNLVISVFDQFGNLITDEASISLSPTFDVTVNLTAIMTFKVVVCGCLGVTSPQIATGSGTTSTPYVLQVVNATDPTVILASTHKKGLYALPAIFTTSGIAAVADYERSAAGDLTFHFYPPFTGSIQVFSPQ